MSLRSRLVSRFIDKTYRCDTKLPKYQYHEIETRMFHSMFELLVDYVESEVAWESIVMESFSDDLSFKRKLELKLAFTLQKFNIVNFRNAEIGVQRLLGNDDFDFDIQKAGQEFADHPNSGQQLVDLYKWYKEVYLTREDDYICEETKTRYYLKYREMPPETSLNNLSDKKVGNYFDIFRTVEEELDKEEDEKLSQLISLRRTMWT